jgi:nitrate/nitrite transporter NarK
MIIHFSQEVLEVLEALVVVLGVLVRVPLSIILPKTSMLVRCSTSSL